jgi:hypothetical protein
VVLYAAHVLSRLNKDSLTGVERQIQVSLKSLYPEFLDPKFDISSASRMILKDILNNTNAKESRAFSDKGEFSLKAYLRSLAQSSLPTNDTSAGENMHLRHPACSVQLDGEMSSYLSEVLKQLSRQQASEREKSEVLFLIVSRVDSHLSKNSNYQTAKDEIMGKATFEAVSYQRLIQIINQFDPKHKKVSQEVINKLEEIRGILTNNPT